MGAKKVSFLESMKEKWAEVSETMAPYIKGRPHSEWIIDQNDIFHKKLNQDFGVRAVINVDWGILPDNFDQWPDKKQELMKGLYSLYYYSIRRAFEKLALEVLNFGAVIDQIDSIEIMPNKKHGYSIGFKDNKLFILKNFEVGYHTASHKTKADQVADTIVELIRGNTVMPMDTGFEID